jgi:NAD(P)-dependent dehydrogenase (short-subunit alcohol dehydrogenase family)
MNDSVVLVTGGAGNVGRAVTRTFLEAGARVAVPFYKNDPPSALDEARARFGDRLQIFALDLTTERGAEQAVQQVMEWHGRLDAVAHLIGGYSGGRRVAETPLEVWERMLDLNLRSALLTARFAIPHMVDAGGGSLVFVSARAARTARVGQAAYAVAKSALITLSEAIAEEYREEGVRANTVLLGTVDTEANRASMPNADHSTWVRPEEIARVIVYLASSESASITGASIPVCGRS